MMSFLFSQRISNFILVHVKTGTKVKYVNTTLLDIERGMDGIETPPAVGADEASNALRFEDLTIDDDLPLLDRVVRYCRSGIALQRLVHVKMLAETAETVGYVNTASHSTDFLSLVSLCDLCDCQLWAPFSSAIFIRFGIALSQQPAESCVA